MKRVFQLIFVKLFLVWRRFSTSFDNVPLTKVLIKHVRALRKLNQLSMLNLVRTCSKAISYKSRAVPYMAKQAHFIHSISLSSIAARISSRETHPPIGQIRPSYTKPPKHSSYIVFVRVRQQQTYPPEQIQPPTILHSIKAPHKVAQNPSNSKAIINVRFFNIFCT